MEQESRKPRRPRRSKADIENCINKAAKELVLKKRFSNVTVLDIIKRAKIEPITFYSRIGTRKISLSTLCVILITGLRIR